MLGQGSSERHVWLTPARRTDTRDNIVFGLIFAAFCAIVCIVRTLI